MDRVREALKDNQIFRWAMLAAFALGAVLMSTAQFDPVSFLGAVAFSFAMGVFSADLFTKT
jgi:hypothetical protein